MAICTGITADLTIPRITCDYVAGDVRGYDSVNAYRLVDVYDTDVANGWGLVTKIGNVYIFEASLYIEGADTFFKDDDFIFDSQGSFDDIEIIYVFEEANFQISNFYINGFNDNSKFCFIYGAGNTIDNASFRHIRHLRFKNSTINKMFVADCDAVYNYENNNLYNLLIVSGHSGMTFINPVNKMQNVVTKDMVYGIIIGHSDQTIEQSNLSDNVNDIRFITDGIHTINLKDSVFDIDNYSIFKKVGATTLNGVSQLYISIQNAANASATLYDQAGNVVISGTLDADGKWDVTDPITYVQRYVETDGSSVVKNTKTVYEPFTLKVTKIGYQDLAIPNIYATELQDDGSRKGTLSGKVVSGKMEKKRPVDKNAVTYAEPKIIDTIKTDVKIIDTIKTSVKLCEPA